MRFPVPPLSTDQAQRTCCVKSPGDLFWQARSNCRHLRNAAAAHARNPHWGTKRRPFYALFIQQPAGPGLPGSAWARAHMDTCAHGYVRTMTCSRLDTSAPDPEGAAGHDALPRLPFVSNYRARRFIIEITTTCQNSLIGVFYKDDTLSRKPCKYGAIATGEQTLFATSR